MGALPCKDAESLTRPLTVTLNALQAFVNSAAADDQLRQKLHAASGLDDVVDLASSQGHEFSKVTLLKAHAEAISKAPDHALEAINSWGDALMNAFGATDKD
jgi:predicted ribosomally synthesized peptide with nif11-like leader